MPENGLFDPIRSGTIDLIHLVEDEVICSFDLLFYGREYLVLLQEIGRINEAKLLQRSIFSFVHRIEEISADVRGVCDTAGLNDEGPPAESQMRFCTGPL